jgi:Ca-activated chloride channel family protein
MFAANLADPIESNIKPPAGARRRRQGRRRSRRVQDRRAREMWVYLLLAVIAIVTAIEWLTYHRRVTV